MSPIWILSPSFNPEGMHASAISHPLHSSLYTTLIPSKASFESTNKTISGSETSTTVTVPPSAQGCRILLVPTIVYLLPLSRLSIHVDFNLQVLHSVGVSPSCMKVYPFFAMAEETRVIITQPLSFRPELLPPPWLSPSPLKWCTCPSTCDTWPKLPQWYLDPPPVPLL